VKSRNDLPETFWSKVAVGEPQQCWMWKGSVAGDNYGVYWFRKKHVGAHRVAWIHTFGEIPKHLQICHACDVPLCCNPRHMWLGTVAENARDRDAKGRSNNVTGERNPCAKVNADQVRAMRLRYASGNVTCRQLGKEYGLKPGSVHDIVARKNWKHV
jgi:hypothetical protein